MKISSFEKKVWLSSPTMHGEELEYVTEAYNTNWMSTVGENINEVERIAAEKVGCKYAVALSCGTSAQIMKGSIIEPMAVIHTGAVISVGCIISAGAVINHASMCCDGVHVDCNATVAGATLVPAGMKIKSGEVYDRKEVEVNDFFFNPEEWARKLNEINQPYTPTPINGKTYNFDDVM